MSLVRLAVCGVQRRRQRGYATIFTLLLFVAVALATFSMYDVGQANTDKVRLQNAADAAAYSATNMMARDFNFMAYTNRAMVANQAAIGQMVGMASWVTQVDQTASNINTAASFLTAIPVAGAVINAATNALDSATTVLRQAADIVASAAIPVLDGVIQGLSMAQHGHHQATLAAAPTTMSEIIQENDPDASLGAAGNAQFWLNFFEAWGQQVERNNPDNLPLGGVERDFTVSRFQEFTDIVSHSTDDFTHQRRERWLELTALLVRSRIDKRGGSEFDMREESRHLEWDWSSMDTESLYLSVFNPGGLLRGRGWGSYNEMVPIGWGAAHGKDRYTTSNSYDYTRFNSESCIFGSFCFTNATDRWGDAWHNTTSAGAAQAWYQRNNVRKINGLQKYYDFAHDRDPNHNADLAPGDTSQGPSLGVFVHKSADDVKTTAILADKHDAFPDADTFDIEEHGGAANGQLGAVARAELYFKRPSGLWPKEGTREARYVGRHEHGNLYNPYWQVRQVEATEAQRAAANIFSYADFSGVSFGGG